MNFHGLNKNLRPIGIVYGQNKKGGILWDLCGNI